MSAFQLICSCIAIVCNGVAVFFLWKSQKSLNEARRLLDKWEREGAPSARVAE